MENSLHCTKYFSWGNLLSLYKQLFEVDVLIFSYFTGEKIKIKDTK